MNTLPPLSQNDYARLKSSIAQDGQRVSILRNSNTGEIIDGEHRLRICQELGIEPLIEDRDLDTKEATRLKLTLNLARRHLTVEQKQELVKELRAQKWTQEEVAEVIGVDRSTVSKIENGASIVLNHNTCPPDLRYKLTPKHQEEVAERVENGETQRQVAADYGISRQRVGQIKKKIAKKKARIVKPDPDAEGGFHLVHGDMFTADLPGDVDLVITDFPYNISGGGKFTKEGSEAMSFDAGDWDKTFDTEGAIKSLTQKLRPGGALVFFADRVTISKSWKFCASIGLEPKAIIVWHKTNPVPNARRNFMSATEFILWTVKPGAEYTWNGEATTHNHFECGLCQGSERLNHPTQKPKKLMTWLVGLFSNDGDIVLDPCAGVGSTGACGLNRRYWLIEKEVDYFEQMEKRLQNV